MTSDQLFEVPSNDHVRAGWMFVALMIAGLPWGMWGLVVLIDGAEPRLTLITAMAGLFVMGAVIYMGLHGVSKMGWFSLPVLMTLRAMLEYIGIPAWRFIEHAEAVDDVYVHALFLTLIGFGAFWLASTGVMKERGLQFLPSEGRTPIRVVFASSLTLAVGIAANVLMWKVGIFSYAADADLLKGAMPFLRWLTAAGNLLNSALIIAAIEVLGNRRARPVMKVVLWVALVASVGFGAVSGMKGQLLTPLLLFVVVYRMTKGRLPKAAFIIPVILILIYPFENAYRQNLDGGLRSQVTTVSGQVQVLSKSFFDVVESSSSQGSIANRGTDETSSRLSELTYTHDIIGLPDYAVLQGRDSIWMAPFYPFVPRILWPAKPELNKGSRLSVALGRPASTASAVTLIGDFYSLYGTWGVLAGMLALGCGLQLFMNTYSQGSGGGGVSARMLFVYVSMLLQLIDLETDVATYIADAVQVGMITVLVSYAIYGGTKAVRAAAPQRALSIGR